MNVLYEAIASLHRQVDERIADDATTPCLLSFDRARAVLDALLAYTAQPEQEPVAHTLNCVCGAVWDIKADGSEEMAHTPNTTPPQRREWVGLTADEIWKCNAAPKGSAVEYHICMAHQNVLDFAEAIEAKLKEKNT